MALKKKTGPRPKDLTIGERVAGLLDGGVYLARLADIEERRNRWNGELFGLARFVVVEGEASFDVPYFFGIDGGNAKLQRLAEALYGRELQPGDRVVFEGLLGKECLIRIAANGDRFKVVEVYPLDDANTAPPCPPSVPLGPPAPPAAPVLPSAPQPSPSVRSSGSRNPRPVFE